MRKLLRVGVATVVALLLVIAAGTGWFLLSSDDLPDVRSLALYNPAGYNEVGSGTGLPKVAVLAETQLRPLFAATDAAERHMSEQIARGMFCDEPMLQQLSRELKEVRLSAQIRCVTAATSRRRFI